MKFKLLLLVICLLFVTGCNKNNVDYNLKLEYITEKNKLEMYLMNSEVTKQDDSYYFGNGFECDANSEYAHTFTSEEGWTYYHCINSEKERAQNYYQINPSLMSFKYFSNLSISKLSKENSYSAHQAYYDIIRRYMFQLEYKIETNSISGYYQVNYGSTLDETYTLNYNYNSNIYTCLVGKKDDYYQNKNCTSYEAGLFKKNADELKTKMDKILSDADINVEKVREYLTSIESND